ncbi:hypothetical protein JTB14_026241 [Gonioctena quinquepunctata]|nr:hypothetical protein JTB14_026241 [Gonioctena quinquepunctata]
MKDKLLKVARDRNDELGTTVISLIETIPSLVEANVRYHRNCFDKFKYIPRPSTSSHTPDPVVGQTMQAIYNYIENHDECQFTLKELRRIGNNALCGKTIQKYLQLNYKEDITIVTRFRKETIICYSGTGTLPVDEYWYLHKEEKKEDDNQRIVHTAAELVLKQIRSTSYDCKVYPSSANFLDNVETDIPTYLNTFLSVVMLDKFIKKNERRRKNVLISIETLASDRHSEEEFASYDSSKKKMEVKKNYLAHSIISAVRPKSFVSTFHHATGLYINRKSGSKLIVNLLSNLGVCASYYDVALHETSAIKAEVTQITPPVFAQYVYDNADHNAQTIDGKNTIHVAAGIVALHPPSAKGTGDPVPKLERLPLAAEVASFGHVPLKEYTDHGSSLKSVVYEDVQKYEFGTLVAGLTPVYTTYLWGRHLKVWELPNARGFLEKVSRSIKCPVSRVVLLPIIDEDPSNPQTIYTALHYAADHAKDIGMKTCFVTFDYALWIKAKQILCNTQDEKLEAVQLRLGGFHLLMSYLKAVGTIMSGSGIKELFGTVFAFNSVDKMLNCTSYSRTIRGHILAATAIDIVEVNQDDDDNDDNFLEDQSSEEILPDSEIVIRPGYLKIMQGIYGSYSDDDNEDTEDEDDNSTTEQAYEVPNSLPSTSGDQPISKRRRNK